MINQWIWMDLGGTEVSVKCKHAISENQGSRREYQSSWEGPIAYHMCVPSLKSKNMSVAQMT